MVKKEAKEKELLGTTAFHEQCNVDDFVGRMLLLSDSAVGVFIIRTREQFRCLQVLQKWAISQEMDFKCWTILTGWQTFPQASKNQTDDFDIDITKAITSDKIYEVVKAFDAISSGFPQDGCYVFMNPHFAFDKPPFIQHIKAHVQRALDNRQRVVLIVPEHVDIPQDFQDDIFLVDFKLPSFAELLDAWRSMLKNVADGTGGETNCRPDFSEADVNLIIQNSLGMSTHEFETSLAIALVELRDRLATDRTSVTPHDFIKVIMRTKVEVIKRTDILELLPETPIRDVGGLDLLKLWVKMRRGAFSQEAQEFGIDTPKGILSVGPPGTGKSLMSKAVASELSIPCIRMDIGAVFGKFVGESEGRMRRALKLVEAMAPCVLFIDEVDKGFGGMSGGTTTDSGVSSRVFGTILTWMQERDTKVPVFVIMTANNIIGLPPELMRKGRLDEIFAVTFPSERERIEIMKIHLRKRKHSLPDSDLKVVAQYTVDFVGSELEAVIKDALITAFYRKEDLTLDHLLEQAKAIIPLSKSFEEKVRLMNTWAKNNAKPASSGVSFDDAAKSDVAKQTLLRGPSTIRKRIKIRKGQAEN